MFRATPAANAPIGCMGAWPGDPSRGASARNDEVGPATADPTRTIRGVTASTQASRGTSSQGIHTTIMPFEMLNVAAVQYDTALRYETWYVRVPPLPGIRPCALTAGFPAPG
jgi:hypothetical protein